MSRSEFLVALVVVVVCVAVVVIGGVFHPNTVSGAVARFFFSLN